MMGARYQQLRLLVAIGRRLNLSPADSAKLLASYYLGRAPAAVRHAAPRYFVLNFAYAGTRLRALIRPNAVDWRVLSDVFVEEMYKVPAGPVRTILDLGANIGISTLFLHARFPEAAVACVEPVPDNLELLRQTVMINGLQADILAGAIGVTDGEATLALSSDPSVHSLVPGSEGLRTITVPQISIASLMRRVGWTRIDLLKIDIEGYEKTLFASDAAWLDATGAIVGEAHAHVHYRLPDLERDLSPHGFHVRKESEDPVDGMLIFTAVR